MKHLTLLDVKEGVRDVAYGGGLCDGDPRLVTIIQQAVDEIANMGLWQAFVQCLKLCCSCGCLRVPSYVDVVLAAEICGRLQTMSALSGEFLPGRGGMSCPNLCAWSSRLVRTGRSTALLVLPEEPCYLLVFSTSPEDEGIQLRFMGLDEHNREIYEDGEPGALLTLNNDPPRYTRSQFAQVLRVIKPVTKGYVRVVGISEEPAGGASYSIEAKTLAYYHPREVNPSYAEYQFKGASETCTEVNALVKLGSWPLQYDTDAMIVQNLGAIRAAVQMLEFRRVGDIRRQDAYRELVKTLLNEENRAKRGLTEQPRPIFRSGLGVGLR